jgi:hypothetical protein
MLMYWYIISQFFLHLLRLSSSTVLCTQTNKQANKQTTKQNKTNQPTGYLHDSLLNPWSTIFLHKLMIAQALKTFLSGFCAQGHEFQSPQNQYNNLSDYHLLNMDTAQRNYIYENTATGHLFTECHFLATDISPEGTTARPPYINGPKLS